MRASREPAMNAEHKPPLGYATQAGYDIGSIQSSFGDWEKQVWQPAITAAPERQEQFLTQSMRWEIKPLYTPLDLQEIGFDYHADLGYPGQAPFTRETR